MAEVRINVQQSTMNSITPAYGGGILVPNTYLVRNNGRVFLHVKKSGAGACNVVVDTPGKVGGLDIAQLTVAVEATVGDRMIGPFDPALFNDSNQDLKVTFSEVTGLTVAAIGL